MEDPAVVISVVEIASDMVTTLDAIPLAKDMALHAVKSGIASDAWETIVHGADKAASKGLVCAGFKIESPTSLVLVAGKYRGRTSTGDRSHAFHRGRHATAC